MAKVVLGQRRASQAITVPPVVSEHFAAKRNHLALHKSGKNKPIERQPGFIRASATLVGRVRGEDAFPVLFHTDNDPAVLHGLVIELLCECSNLGVG